MSVGAIAHPLEGAARPGHFDGVATVVAILFGLIGAEHAYFGQKDAQQVMVIRQMARDLALPTQVIACPTVREPDGLALSSRNVHLTPAERAAAPVLHRALLAARASWVGGERSGDALRARMRGVLAAEPLANVDYVSVADGATLRELDRVEGPALLSLAVSFGSTRLIDNEILDGRDRDLQGQPRRRSRPSASRTLTRTDPPSGHRRGRGRAPVPWSAGGARRCAASSPSTSKSRATSARISAILSRSAGWVLTSRSWIVDAAAYVSWGTK